MQLTFGNRLAMASRLPANEPKFLMGKRRPACAGLILKTAVQPRMGTDGHGYHAVAKTRRCIGQMKDKPVSKSVFIRVHPVELLPLFHRVNPWLKSVLSNANCGNWVKIAPLSKSPLAFRVPPANFRAHARTRQRNANALQDAGFSAAAGVFGDALDGHSRGDVLRQTLYC